MRTVIATVVAMCAAAFASHVADPQPLAAASALPAVVVHTEGAESTDEDTQLGILVRLETALEEIGERNRRTWGCVELRRVPFAQATDPQSELAPLVVPRAVETARVLVRAGGIKRPGPEGEPQYGVRVRLDVKGQGGAEFEIMPAISDPRAGPPAIQQALEHAAAFILKELTAGFRPCVAKARLRGKARKAGADSSVNQSFIAEGDLEIREDGSLESSVRMRSDWSLSIPPQAHGETCMGTGTVEEMKLRISGDYREADASLALTALRLSGGSMAWTGTCQAPGAGAVTLAGREEDVVLVFGVWERGMAQVTRQLDLTGGATPAIAFQDGAALALSQPAGLPAGWSWEMTLELEYMASSGPGVTWARRSPE